MGIGSWRKLLLALVPGLVFAAGAYGDDLISSRRIMGPPLPPPDIGEQQRPAEIIINPNAAYPYYGPGPGMAAPPAYSLPYSNLPSCAPPVVAMPPSCAAPYAAPGGCDIPMNCCDACRCWTIRGGAVFLRRDSNDSRLLTDGATPITIGGLDTDYSGGPLVTAIRHNVFGSGWDFELTYFGVYGMDGSAASAGTTQIFTTPVTNLGGGAAVGMNLQSRLNSTEANLRRPLNDWFTFLAGFRQIDLGEDLATDIGGGTATIGVDTNNHLWGGQIGLDALLVQRGNWRLEGYAKAGVFSNSVDNVVTTANVFGAVPTFTIADNRTAFVGDLALTGVYQWNDHWSIRGGYQLLWVDGVGLATDQFGAANIATGTGTIDYSTAFYHGFTIAAECTW